MTNCNIAAWNVGRWHGKYIDVKKGIVEGLAASVVFLNKTWFRDHQMIEIEILFPNQTKPDGYKWYGNNRTKVNRDAPRGSGGVGCLIHRTIIHIYDVDIMEFELDSMIAISLKNKCSSFKALLIGVYLPPENSVYGNHIVLQYLEVI